MRPKIQTREVKMHFIQYADDPKNPFAYQVECNCGWLARHRRLAVLEGKMDRHLERVGGGVKPL